MNAARSQADRLLGFCGPSLVMTSRSAAPRSRHKGETPFGNGLAPTVFPQPDDTMIDRPA